MIFDVIKKRRSVFPAQYTGTDIPKENIVKILEAANCAPTHRKTEPWRFKVLQGEAKDKLGLFMSLKYMETDPKPKQFTVEKLISNPKKAGAVIAICMQRDPKESVPEWEEIAATAMAVQNMWLCCTHLGIGCYWSTPGSIKYMDEFFNLNEGEKCIGLFYMGNYEGEIPEVERGSWEEKVTWM